MSLYFEGSNTFAGIIVSKGLQDLLDRFTVKLTTTLSAKGQPEAKRTKKSRGKAQGRTLDDAVARIVVYGKMEDKDPIRKLMADSRLFFQHPRAGEAEADVPYFNPHILLRPGAQMPKIEGLPVPDSNTKARPVDQLDEVGKARVWRIFDLANGVEDVTCVKPSRRLRSTLRE